MSITYLDYNATSPPDPRVVAAMEPYLLGSWGNPSSAWYSIGRQARQAIDQARARVASLLGCDADELLFTSSGSEANSQAVLDTRLKASGTGARPPWRLVTSSVEHESVRRAAGYAASLGASLEIIGVDGSGRLDVERLRSVLDRGPAIVSLLWANNETGVLQDLPPLVELVHDRGGLLHVDGVQALGRVEVNLAELSVDLLTVSGHKIHGPKGCGVLFLRRGVTIEPRIFGGGQEHRLRGGTENVAAIVGFGKACALLERESTETQARLRRLRDRLEKGVLQTVPDTVVFGAVATRIANTSMMGWRGVDGHDILRRLDRLGICAASGSACTSEAPEPSHVLAAMSVPPDLARSAVRFSLGPGTTEAEIEHTVGEVATLVDELRVDAESRP